MESRNKEQEKVFFIIYQCIFLTRMGKSLNLEEIISETMEEPYHEVSLFVKDVTIKMIKNYQEEEKIIRDCCTTWKFERINLVVIAILMLAITEGKYLSDIPKNVVIDVAVNLTKKYAGEKDYKFVNAVLDKVLA